MKVAAAAAMLLVKRKSAGRDAMPFSSWRGVVGRSRALGGPPKT
jgi:hypothetical protein